MSDSSRDPFATNGGPNFRDGSQPLFHQRGVLRRNEMQVWFLAEDLIDTPVVRVVPIRAHGDAG